MVTQTIAPSILNKQAVALTNKQEYVIALETFRQAIAQVHAIAAENSPSDGSNFILPLISYRPISGYDADQSYSISSDSCLPFFGFLFDFDDVEARSLLSTIGASTDAEHSAKASILLYNMALTLHYRGLCQSKSSHLKRAINIYKMALQVLDWKFVQHSQELILLSVAALNNLGQICSIFYAKNETQWCIDQLNTIMEYLEVSEEDDNNNDTEKPVYDILQVIYESTSAASVCQDIMTLAPSA